jgi:hypothetical protein
LKDLADIVAHLPVGICKARSIAGETAGLNELAPLENRGDCIASRQADQCLAMAVQKWVGGDHECIGSALRKHRKRRLEIARRRDAKHDDLLPAAANGRRQSVHARSVVSIVGVDQDSNRRCVSYQFAQQFEPF